MARCGCNPVCNCLIRDGVCTDVTGLGTPTVPYKIDVKVDGLTVTCGPNGLQSQVDIDPLDTNTVDMHVTGGPAAFIVSADVIIDPASGALLTATPQGLLVSCEAVQDCIGQEIGPALAGTCLVYNDGANRIDVQIDPDPSNQVGCGTGPGGAGLYVPPSPTVVQVIDNAENISAVVGPSDTITFDCVPVPVVSNDPSCLAITGDTCSGLVFDLNISPDPCNGLECRGNGLFVFVDPEDLPNIGGPVGNAAFGPANGNFNVNFGPVICQTATNPSACRSMRVDLAQDLSIDYGRTSGDFTVQWETSFNGPGGPFATDPGFASFAPEGVSRRREGKSKYGTVMALAPGASVTVCMQLRAIGNGAVNAQVIAATFAIDLHAKWID